MLDIMYDSYGYIWFATHDGLNKYDGAKFKKFSFGDNGLNSNLIISLCEDKNRNIWIGTAGDGLFYYVRQENKFYHHTELTEEYWAQNITTLRHICIDDDGVIWAYNPSSYRILSIDFDYENKKIKSFNIYKYYDGLDKSSATCSAVIDGTLYMGTSDGLLYFSRQDNCFLRCSGDLEGYVTDINTQNGHLFVSFKDRLMSINLENSAIKRDDSFTNTQCIVWKNDRVIWSATPDGLYAVDYDSKSNSFSHMRAVESFEDLRVYDMLMDDSNGVWVGYLKAGASRYEYNEKYFEHFKGFGNNQVQPIFSFDNKLWVGTDGSGLYVFDECGAYEQPLSHMLKGQRIYSIEYSTYSKLIYVATMSAIYTIEPESYHCELYAKSDTFRKITFDDMYMWISTYGEGLIRYNLSDGCHINLTQSSGLPSNIIRNQMIDSRGDLWICSDNGLAKINATQRRLESPNINVIMPEVISSHYIIPIIEDLHGNIWYGTLGHGLFMISPTKNPTIYDIKNYTTNDGLPNNVIKSIEQRDNGDIWFSTNRGVCCLDKASNIFCIYDQYDGLQNQEFNELASVKLTDGRVVFGGVDGINRLVATPIKKIVPKAKPIITDFKIFGTSVFDTDQYKDLIPGILEPRLGIKLDYTQNNFSITFANLNFSKSHEYRLRYCLVGYDTKPIEISSDQRSAFYTNILPGKYRLTLQSTDDDGVWSDEIITLKITITPPIWATWYAFLFYIFSFTTILMVIAYYYSMRVKRQSAIAMVNAERKRIAEMLELRTRFFTNISHEFRTPLTLILSPLQKIMTKSAIANDPQWELSLKTMEHNANSLLRLINDLLAYVKQESGKLNIELTNLDFAQLARDLFSQFKFLAEQKDITLTSSIPQSKVMLLCDKHLMEQIIGNLVSNAIKHTPLGGQVHLEILEKTESIEFSVRDSGAGINEQIVNKIFERFESLSSVGLSNSGGTGIGLVLTKSLVEMHNGKIWFETKVNQGTIFFVEIPKLDNNNIASQDTTHQSNKTQLTQAEATDRYESGLQIDVESTDLLPTMLIVDDNRELLILLKELFSNSYQVVLANGGKEGIELAIELIPDVIISDVMMPDVDGLQLCKKIKTNPTTSHIPIMMLTAKCEDQDAVEGYRNYADAYCVKPFNNTLLIERINALILNRRLAANKLMAKATNRDSIATSILSDTSSKKEIRTLHDKEFIERAIAVIEQNMGNPDFSVTELSDKVGATPLILNKKLKALMNTTANVLIRSMRIKHAAALLKTGRYSISDVTYDVGFTDLRYFRECFRREYGMLPQAYKEQFTSDNL
ncbi:MAG: ATP-binding protein [Rikenellaceae bacterium]